MHISNRVCAHAARFLCLVLVLLAVNVMSVDAFASRGSNSSSSSGTEINGTIPLDRYGETSTPTTSTNTSSGLILNEEPEKTKDEVDLEEFNGSMLDTAIYILGGIAGFMMILQIAFYCLCRVFTSLNDLVSKLKFAGITGYDDSLPTFCIKAGLLGILSYLCLSGIMKQLIGWVLGLLTNIFTIGRSI